MLENRLDAPPVGEAATREPTTVVPWRWLRRYVWWWVGVSVVLVSTVLLLWARTRPGYDPYGWLVWGYQTLHLSLDLGGAPSWKPLPYLFTVPYALAGHRYELRLWMITSVAVSLSGSIFAGRIAYRVTREALPLEPAHAIRGYAPAAAAIFAGVALLGLEDYMHYILSVQSDPMIVTFCLAAIDMVLSGHHRWALLFGVLGSLGRPEVWPFLGAYLLWAWFTVRSMRWMVVGAVAVIAFMWFGIPWITNGRPDIAGELALRSPRELHQNKVFGTIGRFTELQYLPLWIAALGTVGIAVGRRHRVVLALAAALVLWVLIEIAFAFHGFPALSRYMFEPAAVAVVLAGIGVGWVLSSVRTPWRGLPTWWGLAAVAALAVALLPGAVGRLRAERIDLRLQRGRTNEIGLMQTAIDELGGPHAVRACGEPVTDVEFASVLAWDTRLDVGSVGYLPGLEMRKKYPIVLMLPVSPGGWSMRPLHTRMQQRGECSSLRAAYVLTKRHPSGVLVRGRGASASA